MAELRKEREVEIALTRGSGGVFEITLDGTLIYSKKATGRFPELREVLEHIPA